MKSNKGTSNDRPVVIVRKKRETKGSRPSPTRPKPNSSSPVTRVAKPATSAPPAITKAGPNRKEREKQARRELLEILRDRWPQAFPPDPRLVKPLAIGIRQDIAAHLPDQPPGRIGFVISTFQYIMRPAYYRAVLQGGPRYDLDGNPRGEVTLKEREQAKQDLHAYYEEQRNKKPAPRAAAPYESPPVEGEGTRHALPTAEYGGK